MDKSVLISVQVIGCFSSVSSQHEPQNSYYKRQYYGSWLFEGGEETFVGIYINIQYTSRLDVFDFFSILEDWLFLR